MGVGELFAQRHRFVEPSPSLPSCSGPSFASTSTKPAIEERSELEEGEGVSSKCITISNVRAHGL